MTAGGLSRGDGDAVAVVGMGCVFPGAADAAAYWRNIVAGVDAVTTVPPDRADPEFFTAVPGAPPVPDRFLTDRGGFVGGDALAFDPARFGVMPVAAAGSEPDQLIALSTAAAALDDAGGTGHLDRTRVGVILGRGSYLTPGLVRLDQRVRTANQLLACLRDVLPDVEDERLVAVKDAFTAQLGDPGPEAAIGLVPNLAASRIANRLDLGGPAYTVDAACASSLVAVDAALAELRSGRCDMVLAGGVHHCHDVTLWSVFHQLGALSPSGTIRPFSRDADGLVIGEGTGIVVLERLASAEQRGHRIYAVVRGTGVASDGRDTSLMTPRVDGQVLALERAYRAAAIDPGTVGLVEGHGTATAAGDRAELETVRRIFGKPGGSDDAVPGVLGSVKSMIGHAMPAAGAAGLIKALLAVHHGVLPPTLHAAEPHPALADTRFRLLGAAEPWESAGPRRAGVNAFGFGGINAHVVVEQHDGAGPAAVPAAPALAAARRPDAPVAPAPSLPLPATTVDVATPVATTTDVATATRTSPATPVVAPTPAATTRTTHTTGGDTAEVPEPVLLLAGADAADIAAQLDGVVAGGRLPAPPPSGAGPARLAVVDPDDRRLELARRALAKGRPLRGLNDVWFEPEGLVAGGGRVAFLFPGVEPTFDADLEPVARWSGRELPALPEDAPPLEIQGRQIFAAGRLLHAVLGDLGITPDDVAGHSMGEWTSAFAAGLVPPEDADRVIDELEPGGLEVPGVDYLALGCGAADAFALIAGLPGTTVSHDNCPHQSVVCGPPAAIALARERAGARQVVAQDLPFRSGFHSPAFAPYVHLVGRHWARARLVPPRVPMWSATTCERWPHDPDAVRRLVEDQLVQPVRFRELVERMHADGVRVFVQLGVGSLVAFVDDTLRTRPHLAITAHTARRSGLAQLRRVVAALWAEGVEGDVTRLLPPAPASVTPAVTTPATAPSAISGTPITPTPFSGTPDSPTPAVTTPATGTAVVDATVPAGGSAVAGVPATATAERGRPLLRLDLGALLVRLPASARLDVASPAATATSPAPASVGEGVPAGASGRVLTVHDRLLAEAAEAGSAVAAAFARHAAPTPAPPAPAPRHPAPPAHPTPPSHPGAPAHPTAPTHPGAPAHPGASTNPTPPTHPGASTHPTPPTHPGASTNPTPPTHPGVPGHPTSPAPVGAAPATGQRRAPVGQRPAIDRTVTIGVDSHPWLLDHCFYRQAPGWGDVADRFPVVPMTTMVEMLADVARELAATAAPGTVVAGLDGIRALRWLVAAPATEVRLRATLTAPDRVQASIEGYVRATVHLAPSAAAPPTPTLGPLANPYPSPRDATQLYDEHWMFHGPAFQGVRAVDALGDDGVDGVVEALPTPGATLDCAGQLYGWWVMATASSDFLALPQSIARVDLFRPLPIGRRLATRVRITALEARTVSADIEILDDDGRVAVRITGWVDRRFDSDPPLWQMLRDPDRHLLGSVGPGGVVVVDERWKDSASRELMARRYLTAGERATYEGLNPRAQRHWLLGRVAAKDAVRRRLWDEGHGPLFPAEIALGNDEHGRPEVVDGPGRGRPISISHTSWVGAAQCGIDGGPGVGVDVEAIAPRSPAATAIALTADELALLPLPPTGPGQGGSDGRAGDDRDVAAEWVTRAWAAKEAAGKAGGRGLAGRPHDLPLRAVDGERLLVGDRWVTTLRVSAPVQQAWGGPGRADDDRENDREREDYIVAWTDDIS